MFTDEDLAKLVDTPNEPDIPDLIRYGCKMATGSGKTVCHGDVDRVGILQPWQSAFR